MLEPCLSPRLEALCAENAEIREALLGLNIFTTQDLGAFASDAETASNRLRLTGPTRIAFGSVFAFAKARAEGSDEEKMNKMIDVLNSEGHLIMQRPRCDVHANGFWHRAVNVWVVCPSTSRLLMGQRAITKDVDPKKWTCVCGRVPSGQLSMETATERLRTEISIEAEPDKQISLVFRLKCPREIRDGVFAGMQDGAWIDVYIACLPEEIPTDKLHLDVRAKQAVKYIDMAELQTAFATQDAQYVIPPLEEYGNRLFHYLKKVCDRRPGCRTGGLFA